MDKALTETTWSGWRSTWSAATITANRATAGKATTTLKTASAFLGIVLLSRAEPPRQLNDLKKKRFDNLHDQFAA